jgi:hypothetical protein
VNGDLSKLVFKKGFAADFNFNFKLLASEVLYISALVCGALVIFSNRKFAL